MSYTAAHSKAVVLLLLISQFIVALIVGVLFLSLALFFNNLCPFAL